MRFEMAKALVRRARERAAWIGDDLATLANRTKHVELDVHSVDAVPMAISEGPDGVLQISVRRADGRPLPMDSLRLVEGDYHVGSTNCRIVYLNLTPIDEELLGFLKRALEGVDRVITQLDAAL
jgi:hypothetical protein